MNAQDDSRDSEGVPSQIKASEIKGSESNIRCEEPSSVARDFAELGRVAVQLAHRVALQNAYRND